MHLGRFRWHYDKIYSNPCVLKALHTPTVLRHKGVPHWGPVRLMRRLPEASMPAPQSFLQDRAFLGFVPWAQPLGTGQRRAAFKKASPLGSVLTNKSRAVKPVEQPPGWQFLSLSWAQRHPNLNEVSTCGASHQLQGHTLAMVTNRTSLGWPRFVCLRDLQLERACLPQDPWGHMHARTHTHTPPHQ